jgi:hypothetical protein
MMNFFRKHVKAIVLITVTAFLGCLFLGTAVYIFNRPVDFIAEVNSVKIPMNLFYTVYRSNVKRYQEYVNKPLTEKELNEIKAVVVQKLIQNELISQEAGRYGIIVTDKELKADLMKSVGLTEDGIFDEVRYKAFLNSIGMRSDEYEKFRRKELTAAKVKVFIASSVKVWNYELRLGAGDNDSEKSNKLIVDKINRILGDWYIEAVKKVEITVKNDLILKIS